MKQETYIYPDMAFKLGFTTELPTEKVNTPVAYKAVAKIKENMSTEVKALSSKFDAFVKKMDEIWNGKNKAKALMVVEQGGQTLNITKADGSEVTGAPVAGDMVVSHWFDASHNNTPATIEEVSTSKGIMDITQLGFLMHANESRVFMGGRYNPSLKKYRYLGAVPTVNITSTKKLMV
jgi:hypothetical protein